MGLPIQPVFDEYAEFLQKFERKKTTDDCYTPENIYGAVLDWAARRYGFDKAAAERAAAERAAAERAAAERKQLTHADRMLLCMAFGDKGKDNLDSQIMKIEWIKGKLEKWTPIMEN